MATKNVVPRANGEGELGTSSKQWKKVNAQQFTGSIGVSASFFEGDGSRLTNVGGGSSFSVTGDVNNRVITADGSSGGVGEANLTFDGSTLGVTGDATVSGVVTSDGFTIGSAVITEGELERLDGASTTVAANKVVIADGSKNVATLGTVGCGAITSTGTSTFQNVSASVNVSASAFYGNILVESHPGGSTFPMLSEGTSTGEKQPFFDVSLSYNTSMNRLYVGTLQVNTNGFIIASNNDSHPTEIADKALMYAVGGEMYVKDSGGNQTLISPHDEDGEWQYYSRNTKTGKVVRIRMEKMIRALEELTGQTFIEDN